MNPVGFSASMDLSTMKALMAGGNAMKQLDNASTKIAQLPADAITIAMSAKVINTARSHLDVYA